MTTPGLQDENGGTDRLPPLPDNVPALRLGVPDCEIRAASLAIGTLTGWPLEELVGRSVHVLWPSSDRGAIERRFDNVVLLGSDKFGVLAVAPDGSPVVWVEVEARYEYRGGQRLEVMLRPLDKAPDGDGREPGAVGETAEPNDTPTNGKSVADRELRNEARGELQREDDSGSGEAAAGEPRREPESDSDGKPDPQGNGEPLQRGSDAPTEPVADSERLPEQGSEAAPERGSEGRPAFQHGQDDEPRPQAESSSHVESPPHAAPPPDADATSDTEAPSIAEAPSQDGSTPRSASQSSPPEPTADGQDSAQPTEQRTETAAADGSDATPASPEPSFPPAEADGASALAMAALEAAGVAALAVSAEGEIASATPEVESVLGTPIARLRGRGLDGLFHLKDQAADALAVARARRSRQTVLADLAEGDGRVVLEWVPAYGAGVGLAVLMAQESDSEGSEQQRLQARLVSFVAHDVRESLAAVYCGLRTLDRDLPTDAPQRQTLENTLAESARANRIVDDVLAVTRPGRLTRVELDLGAVLRETLDRYRSKAAAGSVEIVLDLAQGVTVLADLGSLERAFGNLVENALQAMPHFGTLTVASRLEDRGLPGVHISIADTGVGIKADIRPNVFEPFVTDKGSGTGLGLPIARRVVLDHDGQIDFESEEGRGTTFHIWLPLSE